jgi:hypothetical protein
MKLGLNIEHGTGIKHSTVATPRVIKLVMKQGKQNLRHRVQIGTAALSTKRFRFDPVVVLSLSFLSWVSTVHFYL